MPSMPTTRPSRKSKTLTLENRLLKFEDNHRNHISGLSLQIKELGGQPPEYSQDIKGYVIEAFTAIRSFTGLKGALAAMKTTEEA
jgi:hypothetical protein